MQETYQLTEDHFKRFQDAVHQHMQMFGMLDWLIEFDWIKDAENNALAEVSLAVSNRVALVSLNHNWTSEPTPRRITRVAYHETLEILLAPLCTIGKLDQDEVTPAGKICLLEAERHALIRKLENVYMGDW